MSAQLLRRKYVPQFATLERFGAVRAWSVVALYVGIILASISLGHILLQEPLTLFNAGAVAGLMLLIATRLRGLNNIVHECSHATFCKNRGQNNLIGKLCASLTLSSFHKYREEHLSHHAHLGDPELDRDFHEIRELGLEDPLNSKTVVRHLITPLSGRHLPYYLNIDFSSDDGVVFKWFRVSLVFAAVSFAAANPETGVLFVIVPFLFIFQTLNYWADCIDHAGLIGAKDDLEASRNIFVPIIIKLLFFPRNDNYHLVHHLFPMVPARHLQSTHKLLEENPIYASRANAVGQEFGGVKIKEGLAHSSP